MILSRKTIEKYLVFIIPLIALLIFINQFYRQHAHNLSVWKGGGMGMFAALDRPSRSRFVKIFITNEQGVRFPLKETSMGIGELTYILATEPTDKNINTLLQKVKSIRWFYSDALLSVYSRHEQTKSLVTKLPQIKPFGNKPVDIKSIKIETGQLVYDMSTKVLSAKTLREKEYVL